LIVRVLEAIGEKGIGFIQSIIKLFKTAINFLVQLGEVTFLFGSSVNRIPKVRKNTNEVLRQMHAMGITSLPLVFGISIFTGAIAAWQARYQFSNIVPLRYLGTAVCKAVLLELGPVLTALVIAARVGASIAAELGTMKTNEQIDAMECLALDPVRFLVLPRMISGFIMMPVLTIIANFIALVGSWFVAVLFFGLTSNLYISGLKIFFNPRDIYAGLLKASVFGIIIAVMGCYNGLKSDGGAHGVGNATMKAVVSASVLILVFDYLIATILF
jgi:phospholipid/cholesterol/gamma-HCH transport system permease protein